MAARKGLVTRAVERDIAAIAEADKALAESGLAAVALSVAASMDNPKTSATARSMCARSLMDALVHLRELAPPKKESDGIDDLAEARAERLERARSAGAPDLDGATGSRDAGAGRR